MEGCFSDFDGNGSQDIAIVRWGIDENNLTILYNDGEGYFLEEPQVNVGDDNVLEFTDYQLANYPNPFTGETTISFSLNTENTENAEIEIYNVKGQKIENLQITNSPNQQIIWNADNFANGVYFYKLVVDGIAVDTKKMILLK